MDTSTSSTGKVLLSYPYIDPSGVKRNTVRASTPEGLIACAQAAFNHAALTINISQGALSEPTCYPVRPQPQRTHCTTTASIHCHCNHTHTHCSLL